MRCPWCAFEVPGTSEVCSRCALALPLAPSVGGSGLLPREAGLILGRGTLLRQGRYRILGPLNGGERRVTAQPLPLAGQGGSWLATDMARGAARVVLTEVGLPWLSGPGRERAQQRIVAALKSLAPDARLPQLIETFNEDERLFVVMTHSSGRSLQERMVQGGQRLSEREIAKYALQLCELLEVLEQAPLPVTHGQITPEAVLISEDGQQVFLAHFDLRLLTGERVIGVSDGLLLSPFAAPEQQQGIQDSRTDVYGVAATLYYAATGKLPLRSATVPLLASGDFSGVSGKLSPQLGRILGKGLATAPHQRYQRAADLRHDIEVLLAALSSEKVVGATRKAVAEPKQGRPGSGGAGDPPRTVYRRRTGRGVLGLAGAALVVLVVFGVFFIRAPQSSRPAANTSTAPFATAQLTGAGVGVSGGEVVFDTNRADFPSKRQAAAALMRGNLADAEQLYQRAANDDSSDAEAWIYAENVRLEMAGVPSVTVVVVTAFDAVDLSGARSFLQGAYIAQLEVNKQSVLPRNLQLRLVLANLGDAPDGVTTVVQFLAERLAHGNSEHLIAVVGWTSPTFAAAAAPQFARLKLPFLSPTPAPGNPTGPDTTLFPLLPSPEQQGLLLADEGVNSPELTNSRIAVLADPNDPYGQAVATGFINEAQRLLGERNVRLYAFTEGATSADAFMPLILNAANVYQATLLFVAGKDVDAIYLAHAAAQVDPALPVLADDQVYSQQLLGHGASVAAQFVRDHMAEMRGLFFPELVSPQIWSALHIPPSQWPAFFVDDALFQTGGAATARGPDVNAMLAFDGVRLAVSAAKSAAGGGQEPSPDSVRTALSQTGTTLPAFQGVTGSIGFTSQAGLGLKAIPLFVLADAAQEGLQATLVTVLGGIGAFCQSGACSG